MEVTMNHKVWFAVSLLLAGLALVACTGEQTPPTATVLAVMPNPAAAFCLDQGFISEIRTAADGSQSGVCIFPDGGECDEWAYFRGECPAGGPGPTAPLPTELPPTEPPAAEPSATPTASVVVDGGWLTYLNESLAYAFDYPGDAIITGDENPRQTVTVQGPLVDGDNWPVIFVNHPGDRDEFRPPAGVELYQWLLDHNLVAPPGNDPAIGEVRLEDTVIAGLPAVHTRYQSSPQTYAFDKFYFARDGQLYEIVILHAGSREDWDLYNRFLGSFRFQ